MGWFDNPFDKREKVKKIREKQRKEQLELNRDIKEVARREKRAELERKKLESRTASARAEERYYETELKRKKAKRANSPFSFNIPTPKIRKKKQGRVLSRRSRIKLI